MSVLLGRNFARFLLMLYILFCMIIRTAYQGKQFEFLQNEMRPADVKTISEMISRNFSFYTFEMYAHPLKRMEFVKR